MKRIFVFTVLLGIAGIANAQITSSFDTDDDGWTFLNNGSPVTVNHSGSGGNPGGYVATAPYSSNTTSTSQGWFAPTKFLGLKVARSYGMNLHFDLQQAFAGTASSGQGDVRIVGNAGFDIVFSLPVKPAVAPAWSSYTIKLDETAGWRVGNTGGPLATKNDVLRALTNIVTLEIRGTYITNANNVSGLDNVFIEEGTLTPAPTVSSVSANSGKPGDVITINGSGFNTVTSSNAVWFGFFGKIQAVVQSATATRLDVVVPQNVSYGPITITNTVTGLSAQTAPFNPVFDGGGRIIPASFKPKFDIPTILIETISAADVDGDGWIDLAVTNDFTDRAIDIYRNLGSGGTLSAASFDTKVSIAYTGVNCNGSGLWFADLDGDGKPDAITSNTSGGYGLYVTFRNTSTPGSISFEAPEYWQGATDESPISFIGDLDGDGRPEMMSGEGAIPGAFWFNQNISTPGNIEFASWVAPFGLTVLNGFTQANAADLNGDGKPELIVTNGQGQAIDVLQNVSTPGTPAFTEAFQFTTNQYTTSPLLIADMNLDGKNDLLYKTSGEVGFHIRLNSDTDGTLTAADFVSNLIITGDLSGQGGISIADMNGDGKPDIVASDNTDFGVFENVFVGGVFDVNSLVPAYQYEAPGLNTNPTPPIAVDLNGDGKPEIFAGITNAGTPDKLTIYENANIVAPLISLNTVSPLSGPVGSTVTITGSNFSTVTTENIVWFGSVKATVLTATANELTVTVPPGAGYAAVSVTKNELTSKYHLPFQTTFSSGITFNNTHFATPVEFTLAGADYDLEIGDLDNDGLPDIVAEGGTAATTRFRNTHTSGSITTASLTDNGTSTNIRFPRLQDLDGDGKLDLVGVNTLSKNSSTTGNISFLANVTLSGVDGFGIADFGDVNRDGKTDVFVVEQSLAANIVENQSANLVGNFTTGTFASFMRSFVTRATSRGSLVVADFDNDGYTDMITTNPTLDNISIYENAKRPRANATSFEASVELNVGDNPQRIYSGDFDLDGKLDVLIQHGAGTTSFQLTLFQNTSTVGTILFNRIDLTNPSATTTATVADLDGDGKPEIITTSESGNHFSIFKNVHTTGALTAASFATPFTTTVTAPRGITTGDLNLDSKPEILITRAAGFLVVYENLVPSASIAITLHPSPSTVCEGTTAVFSTSATGTTNISYQWQYATTVAGTYSDLATGGNYSSVTTASMSVNTAGNFGAGYYRCKISGDIAATVFSTPAQLIINPAPAPPSTSNASRCDPGSLLLSASGASNGQYRWYSVSSGGLAISGETNSAFTTPALAITTTYYAAINTGTCESGRMAAIASITLPSNPGVVGSANCGPGSLLLAATGGVDGDYRWYTVATGGTPLAGEVNNSFTTPAIATTTTYYVSLSIGVCETSRVPVLAEINAAPSAPATTSGSSCNNTSVVLQATGGSNGQYRWYTSATGGSSLVGEVNDTFSTPLLTATTNYFVSINNGACESSRTVAVATIHPIPTKPVITASGATTLCAGSTVVLSAPTAAGYLWSTSETTQQITVSGSAVFTVSIEDANGCTSLASDPVSTTVNPLPAKPVVSALGPATFCEGGSVVLSAPAGFSYAWSDGATTQQSTITASGNYSVSTTDSNGCTSLSSDPLTVTVNSAPAKPVITPSGGTTLCSGQSITLSAPAGFSYLWSTGANAQQIVVTAAGNYTVQVTDANSCTSIASDAVAVAVSVCNLPPAISSATAQTRLEGSLTLDLTTLLSDPDNNLDLATLRIVGQPTSGAVASINANFELVVNYQGVSFTGDDFITIEVCDVEGECVQQLITIEVVGDIVVMNGLSPNGDNVNDFLEIKYIDLFATTRDNRVTIYNRWGDVVFETDNYDNTSNVFRGRSKNGSELPAGTYLYKIVFTDGLRSPETGYLVLKR